MISGRSSARTPAIVCGLTARMITSEPRTTSAFESNVATPVSFTSSARAWGLGSLVEIDSGGIPTRSIPRIRAVAIFPAPMNPHRFPPPGAASHPGARARGTGHWPCSSRSPDGPESPIRPAPV